MERSGIARAPGPRRCSPCWKRGPPSRFRRAAPPRRITDGLPLAHAGDVARGVVFARTVVGGALARLRPRLRSRRPGPDDIPNAGGSRARGLRRPEPLAALRRHPPRPAAALLPRMDPHRTIQPRAGARTDRQRPRPGRPRQTGLQLRRKRLREAAPPGLPGPSGSIVVREKSGW